MYRERDISVCYIILNYVILYSILCYIISYNIILYCMFSITYYCYLLVLLIISYYTSIAYSLY